MVRIRLRRAGGKGQPTHRLVAADKESPRDGRFIEILGDYNPRTEPATIRLKEDRIYHWLSVGAQPSKAVKQIFGVVGLMERYERFQEGEDLETLLAEAKEQAKARHVDPRTKRDASEVKAAKAEAAAEEEVEDQEAEGEAAADEEDESTAEEKSTTEEESAAEEETTPEDQSAEEDAADEEEDEEDAADEEEDEEDAADEEDED
ncbi:MAG: 30S ribosomal protein S16 [Anaerolineales bacterium]|nr:30S ribosomal protein S16 [Anaerolineales bacterium]